VLAGKISLIVTTVSSTAAAAAAAVKVPKLSKNTILRNRKLDYRREMGGSNQHTLIRT
jgi:hypothetical protein